ncbi:MAG: hypothetical protein E7256_00175 [Lachnospiraceae bacterium]|nr:hypothetical protein [Lachnospiraceae bacterium]
MSMCKCKAKKNEVANVTKAENKSTVKKVFKVIAIMAAVNGVIQLIAKAKQKKDAVNEEKNGNSNIKVYDVFMNGKSIKIENEEFEGIVVKSIMGGVDIDLRNAIIKKNVYITVKNIISGVSIRVPQGVNVKLESRDFLSGSDNLVPEYEGEDVPVIFVETKSYLSGLSIRPASNKEEKTRDEYVEEDIFADVPSEDILKSATQSEKKQETQEGKSDEPKAEEEAEAEAEGKEASSEASEEASEKTESEEAAKGEVKAAQTEEGKEESVSDETIASKENSDKTEA